MGDGSGECVAEGWEFEVWSGVLVESSLIRCFLCHFFKASLGVTYVQTFIKKTFSHDRRDLRNFMDSRLITS